MTAVELIPVISRYFYEYKYLAIPVIIFFITIVPVPFPEELFVFIFGYLCAQPQYSIILIFIITYITVQLSDWLLYFFGWILQNYSIGLLRNNSIIKWKINKGIKYYNKYGIYVIIIARFFFGIRSAVFMATGFLIYRFKKFALLNAATGIFHTLFFLLTGYYFSDKINLIISKYF